MIYYQYFFENEDDSSNLPFIAIKGWFVGARDFLNRQQLREIAKSFIRRQPQYNGAHFLVNLKTDVFKGFIDIGDVWVLF